MTLRQVETPETEAASLSPAQIAFAVEEFKQTMESYRAAMISVISISTVFMVVNATMVGYAVNQRLAGLLLIGPLFPIGMIASVLVSRRMITPMLYTVVNLEHRIGGTAYDWGMTTYASVLASPAFVAHMVSIGSLPTWEERAEAIRHSPMPIIGTGRGIFRALLAVVAIGQIVAAIVMWQAYDWRLF